MSQTISITVSDANAARVATAVGSILGLGRDATGAEIKNWVGAQVVMAVRGYEVQKAQAAAAAAYVDPGQIQAS